jgi:tetratricopeptide (TPR) repeat protein
VVALAEQFRDLEILSHALNTLGQNSRMSGLFDQSKSYFERAYALAEHLGDPTRLAFQCGSRGDLSFLLGAWDQTRVDYERAAVLAQQGSSSWDAGEAYYGLGQLALVQGQEERAAQAFQEARAFAEHSHDLQTLYKVERVLAEADLLKGRPEVAQARLAPLFDREDPQRYDVTLFLPFLAWATLDVGDVPLAEALVAENIERAHRQSVILALPDALRAEARLHLHLGRLEAAEASLEQALVLCRARPCPYTEAKVLYASGQLALQQGEPVQACERWEAALEILHRLGERLYAEQVEQALATWN